MTREMDQAVRERAQHRCEYCHSRQSDYPERFQIDHTIARQHGGPTSFENLGLCCLECNRRKGPNIASIDPETGQLVRLFNPRRDHWNDHFAWHGPAITGSTAIGRATIRCLALNRPPRVLVRSALIEEGTFPPPGDNRR